MEGDRGTLPQFGHSDLGGAYEPLSSPLLATPLSCGPPVRSACEEPGFTTSVSVSKGLTDRVGGGSGAAVWMVSLSMSGGAGCRVRKGRGGQGPPFHCPVSFQRQSFWLWDRPIPSGGALRLPPVILLLCLIKTRSHPQVDLFYVCRKFG